MNKQSKINFYNSIISGYADIKLKQGQDLETKVEKATDNLIKYVEKHCPSIDQWELDDLVNTLKAEKEAFVISILADLECLKVDFDKLPPIEQIDFIQ